MPRAALKAELREAGDNTLEITVSADSFVQDVTIEILDEDVYYSDNSFCLEKGERAVIQAKLTASGRDGGKMRIRAYNADLSAAAFHWEGTEMKFRLDNWSREDSRCFDELAELLPWKGQRTAYRCRLKGGGSSGVLYAGGKGGNYLFLQTSDMAGTGAVMRKTGNAGLLCLPGGARLSRSGCYAGLFPQRCADGDCG